MYKKHVFVCQNKREFNHEKCCGDIGASIRTNLKMKISQRKLNKKIRINKSGCLGKCSKGPCLVVYPDGEWLFNLKLEDCDKIVDKLVSQ
jgi:(2Fe-2S) ferredoxin